MTDGKLNITHQKIPVGDGRIVVHWLSEGLMLEEPPTVALNRQGNGCFFGIDRLHEHNFHAAAWADDEAAEGYIKRVRSAVAEGAKHVGKGVATPISEMATESVEVKEVDLSDLESMLDGSEQETAEGSTDDDDEQS
jgi:hypothetical protein